ncbi:MAG TPA: class I SAM-dependent methyltransferase [Pseudomonadales bacterium]|nr:class I SAM-dependent methyltransferase [Pseudomonadales bacterium]
MADRSTWNERYAAKELVWSAGPNGRFVEEIAPLPPGTALDVACGEGRNAIYLAEQGWEVTGIDFSDVGIDKARRIAGQRGVTVNWLVGDVTEAPLAAGGYDLVSVLYLHTDPATRELWLPKVIAAVAPGGYFIYIGHDPANIEGGVGGPKDPAVLPDAATLGRYLGGFEIEFADVTERPVDQDPGHGGGSGVALDTVVRARRRVAQ